MTQKQQNRLTMNKTVLQLIDANPAIWQTLAPFSRARNELAASITARDSALQTQSGTSTGATRDKENDGNEAIGLVLALARNASAYAIEQKNNDLYARLSYNLFYLTHLPDNEQVAALKEMLKQLTDHAPALTEYNITEEALKEARAVVQKLGEGLTTPRSIIDEQASATQSIPQLETMGRHALGIMDKLIHNFSERNADFVRQYRNARIIVDSGIRHEQDDKK
jgi:hypothetical protein